MNREQCIGCGVHVQTTDPDELGYTPEAALQKGIANGKIYCQRCFKIRHYNELQPASLQDDDFLRLLSSIAEKDALVVFVVDAFDLNGSMISGLWRFVGDNPMIVAANKIDLYPKSVKLNRIKAWIERFLADYGLRPIETLLLSANKRYQIDDLLEKIQTYRKGRDVYVVGVTNVGKSTMINRVIQSINYQQEVITTSQFPGTTLNMIHIPFDETSALIDTPGIIHRHQIAHHLIEQDLKAVLPQKEVRPKTFQLNAEQTIFIGGLIRIDYTKGERNSLTFYVAQQLMLHRTKLFGASDFYAKHKGELLTPPTGSDASDRYPELVRKQFVVKKKSDIVISGLGWVTIQKPGVVEVWSPKAVDVMIRESII